MLVSDEAPPAATPVRSSVNRYGQERNAVGLDCDADCRQARVREPIADGLEVARLLRAARTYMQ